RPPKSTRAQEKVIRRWLADKPTEHGLPTALWTGPRVALMIGQESGVGSDPKSTPDWLPRRGVTAVGLAEVWPAVPLRPARRYRTRRQGDRRAGGGQRRSGVLQTPVSCRGTPADASITFPTSRRGEGFDSPCRLNN